MAKKLYELIPDHEELIKLAPGKLAERILNIIIEKIRMKSQGWQGWNGITFIEELNVAGFISEDKKQCINKVVMEAWIWLENEGFIAPEPLNNGGYLNHDRTYKHNHVFVTRKGYDVYDNNSFDNYLKANIIQHFLHPIIAAKCWSFFLEKKYNDSIGKAFLLVEEAVRKGGKYDNTKIGLQLIRDAFSKDIPGPLRDTNAITAEEDGIMNLFLGAIAAYKNPFSHRTDMIISHDKAAEMLILASHLLNIVDERTSYTVA